MAPTPGPEFTSTTPNDSTDPASEPPNDSTDPAGNGSNAGVAVGVVFGLLLVIVLIASVVHVVVVVVILKCQYSRKLGSQSSRGVGMSINNEVPRTGQGEVYIISQVFGSSCNLINTQACYEYWPAFSLHAGEQAEEYATIDYAALAYSTNPSEYEVKTTSKTGIKFLSTVKVNW